MADVKVIPKIQCDNCGLVEEKTATASFIAGKPIEYAKPKTWGSCRMEGTRDRDEYGNKERLDMADLCPRCASAALNEAANALANIRKEKTDGT